MSLIYGRKEWNDDFLSLGQTKALLGFAALCIMFHHIGQKTSASWIDRKYYIPGLDFFVPIGYILVAFFTFCSGFGLMTVVLIYFGKMFIQSRFSY